MKTIDYLEITPREFIRRRHGAEMIEGELGGEVWRNPDGMLIAVLAEGGQITFFALMVE